jgi:hypothetical protein
MCLLPTGSNKQIWYFCCHLKAMEENSRIRTRILNTVLRIPGGYYRKSPQVLQKIISSIYFFSAIKLFARFTIIIPSPVPSSPKCILGLAFAEKNLILVHLSIPWVKSQAQSSTPAKKTSFFRPCSVKIEYFTKDLTQIREKVSFGAACFFTHPGVCGTFTCFFYLTNTFFYERV